MTPEAGAGFEETLDWPKPGLWPKNVPYRRLIFSLMVNAYYTRTHEKVLGFLGYR